MKYRIVVLDFVVDILTPSDVPGIVDKAEATLPAHSASTVVVLSGRLPVWVFGALVHHYHPAVAVATYDPRLDGGVVVATHTTDYRLGSIINTAKAERLEVNYV